MELPKFPDLVQRIRDAFPPEPVPEDDLFGASDCLADPCNECWQLETHFDSMPWSAVPPMTILAHHEDLSIFTNRGFQYYLPAYLCYALDHFHPDDDVLDWTLLSLRPSDHMADEYLRDRYFYFDERQREVVLEFLQLCVATFGDRFETYDVPAGIERLRRLFAEYGPS
jgi:hypothetical protein